MINNIPNKLREYTQFVMWRYETRNDKPTKVPYSARTGKHASVTSPATWASYDECVNLIGKMGYEGIGFVLTANDPFAFIDLDDPEGDSVEIELQQNIAKYFNSYSEISPSGNGLHIIVEASIPSGRRRKSVEIYSSERFMTLTGNVYNTSDITYQQELLQSLWAEIGGANKTNETNRIDFAQVEDDATILNKASFAENGEKFKTLYQGRYKAYYSSQSEADLAIMNILAFYTQNREQVIRLFRNSGLGVRDKARRDDYVNLLLDKAFDTILPPVDLNIAIGASDLESADTNPQLIETKSLQVPTHSHIVAQVATPSSRTPLENTPPPLDEYFKFDNPLYSYPPGLLGELARYITKDSPRPIAEAGLVAAIGLLSAICGKSFNVSGTGLNQYILFIARTGSGKETISRGVNKIMNQISQYVPNASDFIGPAQIASPQAIIKFMAAGLGSTLSIVGEFGSELEIMTDPRASVAQKGLKRFMLDVYNKSGHNDVLMPIAYSDSAKNTEAIKSPAFSLMGETTPATFYKNLTEDMISDGFLPRFTIIEYTGKRPFLNNLHDSYTLSQETLNTLCTLCATSLQLISRQAVVNVEFDNDAQTILNKFNEFCDGEMRSSTSEVKLNLWNRSHLKSMKLAALAAVGVNQYNPVITKELANWAINLVLADVRGIIDRFEAGELTENNDESLQLIEIIGKLKDFVTLPYSEIERYDKSEQTQLMKLANVVPYSYIHRRLAAVAVFRKDRIGSTNAIKRAIVTLIDRGDIEKVDGHTMREKFKTNAAAYIIRNAKF